MRTMFGGLFLESCLLKWKGDASFFFWQNCPSPIAELLTKMKSVLPYSFQSVCLSASISPWLPSLYSLCISIPLLFILHFFSLSVSPPSLFFFFLPLLQSLWNCKALGWLGTFLTEKFDCDQNHLQAFLHSFPNLNDFAASPTHPPRKADPIGFTLLSCAQAHSFICLSLPLLHTHTQGCTYKIFTSKGGDGIYKSSCS